MKSSNISVLYVEAALYGLALSLAGAYLAVYAIRLGASNQVIGLLTALPSLVNALWLIPSARLIERRRNILPPLLVSAGLMGVQYLAVSLVALVPQAYQPLAMLAIVTLGALPAGLYVVLINTILADVLPAGQRVQILGNRSLLLSISDVLAVFVGGWFLGLLPLPVNYQLLFLIVSGIALLNLWNLRRLRIADKVSPDEAAGLAANARLPLRDLLRRDGEAAPFVRFLIAAFIVLFAGWLPRPLFAVYWVRTLGASDQWVGILMAAFSFTAMIAYPIWGRIASKRSSRWLLLVGSLAWVSYPTLTYLAPTLEANLLPAIIGGFFAPPYNLGLLNGLLDFAPQRNRSTYIAVYTAGSNLASFTAPIISTALIVPLVGIHQAFFLSALARLAGFVAVFVLVKMPNAKLQASGVD